MFFKRKALKKSSVNLHMAPGIIANVQKNNYLVHK